MVVAIECPHCRKAQEVPPGRVCCSGCGGRFDLRPAEISRKRKVQDPGLQWEVVAGTPPPFGIEDRSGGELIRDVRMVRDAPRLTAMAYLKGGLAVLGAMGLIVLGVLDGGVSSFIFAAILLWTGTSRLRVAYKGNRWLGTIITLTQQGLRVEASTRYSASVKELPLGTVVQFRVDSILGRLGSSLAILTTQMPRPFLVMPEGARRDDLEWLAQHLDEGLELAKRLEDRKDAARN